MVAPKLIKGDTIGVVSPCHYYPREAYRAPFATLGQLGFRVKAGKRLYRGTYGYSATEQERADDFNEMVADPAVKLIFFPGGSVGNEVLPLIDFDQIKRHPKRFLSYSDGTSLLLPIYLNTGLITYYGQCPMSLDAPTEYNLAQFSACLSDEIGTQPIASDALHTIHGGLGEGVLIGGFLDNVCILLDGPYAPWSHDQRYLLFLEHHVKYSAPSRISMLLSHLEQSDFVRQVAGLIWGHYAPKEYPELTDRLQRFGQALGIPVVACDEFGHFDDDRRDNHQTILPIGRPARLDANERTLTLL